MGEGQAPQEGGTVVPVAVGEWGSPGRSLNMWWRRWVATQLVKEPSTAMEPMTARVILRARRGPKARWVNSRWKPMVMPKPVIT